MSYQPPFDGNWLSGRREWPAFDKPPQSVQAAVKFIYAGAVIQAVAVIIQIAVVHSHFPSILASLSSTPLTPSQQHTAEVVVFGFFVVSGIIVVSVWLWMASKNNAGRRWARILSTVFFALLSLLMLGAFAQQVTLDSNMPTVAEWLVGLVAIVLLWQRESSEFFSARSTRY
jgi:hypothetical protein